MGQTAAQMPTPPDPGVGEGELTLDPSLEHACHCTYFPPQKILVVMTRLDRL